VTALVVGTVLALGALTWVLFPLFAPTVGMSRSPAAPRRDADLEDPAIQALREIEFDRATGKLSEEDYASLKARYMHRAVTSLRAGETAICDNCGPRPEKDAVYCSRCGHMLSTIAT
jgi:ribosomal protein L40E